MNRSWPILLGIFLTPSAAEAVNPAVWTIVEQINRTDTSKTWVSPTAVDLDKAYWHYDFELTQITATVSVPIIDSVTQDITGLIPEEFRVASGETTNLPTVLLNEMLADEGSGTSADVFVEVDSLGFGRAVFDNIMLGSVDVPIFGNRPIQRINIEATVAITGFDFAVGDYNHDGGVDAADYVVWRRTYGEIGPNLPADGDGNDEIDEGDYLVWLDHFGPTGGNATVAGLGAAVPEPSAVWAVLTGVPALLLRRRRSGRYGR